MTRKRPETVRRFAKERKASMETKQNVYDTELALLRCALWGQEMPCLTEREALLDELRSQRVLTLCADVLKERMVVQAAALGVRTWFCVMEAQKKALSLLKGIPVAVLKGASVDRYYPRPEYRAMGDIDLLIRPEDLTRAVKALEDGGCRLLDTKERHYGFAVDGVHLELHQYFTLRGGQPLDKRLHEALGAAEQAVLQGYTFPVLPKVEEGLVLLEHIGQHLQSGMGLRQMLDWMFYVPSADWAELLKAARTLKLEKLAVTATVLCQRYLGLPYFPCGEADDALCRGVLMQMLERGNFGVKDHDSTMAVSVLNMARHPISFLRTMQRIGCRTWKALEKWPCLKCFAWLYQLCRLARRGLCRRNALGKLREDMGKAETLQGLLDALQIDT